MIRFQRFQRWAAFGRVSVIACALVAVGFTGCYSPHLSVDPVPGPGQQVDRIAGAPGLLGGGAARDAGVIPTQSPSLYGLGLVVFRKNAGQAVDTFGPEDVRVRTWEGRRLPILSLEELDALVEAEKDKLLARAGLAGASQRSTATAMLGGNVSSGAYEASSRLAEIRDRGIRLRVAMLQDLANFVSHDYLEAPKRLIPGQEKTCRIWIELPRGRPPDAIVVEVRRGDHWEAFTLEMG
ncbi:MAG: hypothetical protein ACFE0O_14930 [Opitutales bacterium]